MSDDLPLEAARRRVKAQQAQLIGALVGNQGAPPGFDRQRVNVQAAALRAKRSRLVAAAAPDLVAVLKNDWDHLFDDYARGHPLESSARRTDATSFRRWVNRRCCHRLR
jgi:hypothetical protein